MPALGTPQAMGAAKGIVQTVRIKAMDPSFNGKIADIGAALLPGGIPTTLPGQFVWGVQRMLHNIQTGEWK